MNIQEQLKNIYYVNVPKGFDLELEDFTIDPNVKLPIETDGLDKWNPEEISWEQIISAMLKIMAYNQTHKDLDYYRGFIHAVRPNIIQELTDSAIFKSSEKDFNLSKEIFLAISGLQPSNKRNFLNLAVLLESEAEWVKNSGDIVKYNELIDECGVIYKDLLEEETVLTDVYFNAGYYFIKIREFEKAEICLNSFIEYSDNDDKKSQAKKILLDYKNILGNEELFNKAYSLILEEHEADAINLLTEFLSSNDKIWNAWFLIGWANRRLSNFSEAIAALNQVITLNNEDTDTYNELAICYMELGDLDKSQHALQNALKLSPEDVKIISNLGIIELKKGNIEESKKYFQTVLVYEPNDTIAKHYIEKLN